MIRDLKLREKYYKALIKKNASYDRKFYVGVRTTGVFCRPSCSANKPKFENCEFFKSAKKALYASYRSCKLCKPLSHSSLVNHEVGKLIDAINDEPEKKWKTQDFRTCYKEGLKQQQQFKNLFNMTFIEFARARRIGLAIKKLRFGSSSKHTDIFSDFLTIQTNPKMTMQASLIPTPLGDMIAISDDAGLYLLEFTDRYALETEIIKLREKLNSIVVSGRNKIINQIDQELREYFNAERSIFDTPIHMVGTPFEISVWKILRTIPVGSTHNYSSIAKTLDKPGAARAVGTANGKNQISIIIPCHRVIAANGSLGGYGGGLERKQKLLDLEKQIEINLLNKSNVIKNKNINPNSFCQPLKFQKIEGEVDLNKNNFRIY